MWWEGQCGGRGSVVGGAVLWEGQYGGWWCDERSSEELLLEMHSIPLHCLQIALEHLASHQKNCTTFVELAHSVVCSLSEMESVLASSSPSQRQPMLYSFDHVYPSQHATSSGPAPPVVILYGRLGSQEIEDFHNALKVLAGEGKIKYAFRHFSVVSVRKGEGREEEGRGRDVWEGNCITTL